MIRACGQTYGAGTVVLRNLAQHSKFVRDLWSHPETTRIVSEVAGVPLSVIMPTEMGHTNIQTSGKTVEEALKEIKVELRGEKVEITDAQKEYDPLKENSVIPWQ